MAAALGFTASCSIAAGSCGETQSLLIVASDVGYLDDPTYERLKRQAQETARVITGLRAVVGRQRRSPLKSHNAA